MDERDYKAMNEELKNEALGAISGCRQGDLCIICGEGIDSNHGSVCSNCDDSHLDD